MMNFKSVIEGLLRNPTPLASVTIPLARFFVHFAPILSVIRLPTAPPSWAVFSFDIFGLPIAHTLPTTKVMLIDACVSSSKLLPTPIAIYKLATPSQDNKTAFFTASNLVGFFQPINPIRFGKKYLATHRTVNPLVGFRNLCSVFASTIPVTKPKTRFVVFLAACFANQILIAIRAFNNNV